MSVPAQRLPRLAIKAKIKRASADARRNMNRLDQRAIEDLDRLYRQAAAEMERAILSYAHVDGNLRLGVLQELLGQVDGIIGNLALQRNGQLDLFLDQAAQLGAGAYSSAMPSDFITRVSQEAVQFTRAFAGADGLQLSDRLWRLDQGARQSVADAIQNSIIQGHSASQAVNEFLSQGQTIPPDIAARRGLANAGNVAKLAGNALLRDEANARANAMRVFRTELNRAHGEAYMAAGEDTPDFAGWKFLLSPRHPELDICDMHAKVNRYGLGPGVYPDRERTPWPAHPNTLSYVVIVFTDEVTAADRAGQETRVDWLKKQPGGVQEGVLNSRNKAAALRDGVLTENQISTPWNVLKLRYQNAGVDTDSFGGSGPDIPRPIISGSAMGIPVSNAFNLNAYKRDATHVLDVIDSIHGDGKLPVIPIKRTASLENAGIYRHVGGTRALDIKLSSKYPQIRGTTLIHEIGHFLDHMGFTPGSFASLDDRRLNAWRAAVENSRSIQFLRQLRRGPLTVVVDGVERIVPMQYLNYLVNIKEIWARSYTQYIVTRSADPDLARELQSIMFSQSKLPLPLHWEAADFEPIGRALDELFAQMRWKRGG